jgi:hypothetical protein
MVQELSEFEKFRDVIMMGSSLIGLFITIVTLFIIKTTLEEQVKINKTQLQLSVIENRRYLRQILPIFDIQISPTSNDLKGSLSKVYILTCHANNAKNVGIEVVTNNCKFLNQNEPMNFSELVKENKIFINIGFSNDVDLWPSFIVIIKFEDEDYNKYLQEFEFNIFRQTAFKKLPALQQ